MKRPVISRVTRELRGNLIRVSTNKPPMGVLRTLTWGKGGVIARLVEHLIKVQAQATRSTTSRTATAPARANGS
jgi:hypothetical protein